MFSSKKLPQQVLAACTDFLSSSLMKTDALLSSPKESHRVYGLRRLARSADAQGIDTALGLRETDPSALVRSAADAVLSRIGRGHGVVREEIASRLVEAVVSRVANDTVAREQNRADFSTIAKVLQKAVLSEDGERRIVDPLRAWWKAQHAAAERAVDQAMDESMSPREQGGEALAEEEVEELMGDRDAFSAVFPETDSAFDHIEELIEVYRDLAFATVGLFGAGADRLRLSLFGELQPGPLSKDIFSALAPHAKSSRGVRDALLEVLDRAVERYSPLDPSEGAFLNDVRACLRGQGDFTDG